METIQGAVRANSVAAVCSSPVTCRIFLEKVGIVVFPLVLPFSFFVSQISFWGVLCGYVLAARHFCFTGGKLK